MLLTNIFHAQSWIQRQIKDSRILIHLMKTAYLLMDNECYPHRTVVYSLSCCRTIYLTHRDELVTPGKQVKAANWSSRLPWVPVRHGQWRVAVVASQVEHVSITVV